MRLRRRARVTAPHRWAQRRQQRTRPPHWPPQPQPLPPLRLRLPPPPPPPSASAPVRIPPAAARTRVEVDRCTVTPVQPIHAPPTRADPTDSDGSKQTAASRHQQTTASKIRVISRIEFARSDSDGMHACMSMRVAALVSDLIDQLHLRSAQHVLQSVRWCRRTEGESRPVSQRVHSQSPPLHCHAPAALPPLSSPLSLPLTDLHAMEASVSASLHPIGSLSQRRPVQLPAADAEDRGSERRTRWTAGQVHVGRRHDGG